MALTHDDIAHIATLARIGITDDEKQQYHKELSSVVEYFGTLQEVNTDGVDAIGHITGMTDVVRDDIAREVDDQTRVAIMENVPRTHDGQIAVKNIL